MLMTLPAEALKELNRTEQLVLGFHHLLCRSQAKRCASGAPYDCTSQTWIGNRIGKSREWVNKVTNRLVKKGYLISIRRRKIKGQWSTNLYKLGWKCLMYLRRCKEAVQAMIYRVNCSSHIVNNKYIERINEYKIGVLRTRLQRKKEDPDQMLTELCQRHGCEYVKNW